MMLTRTLMVSAMMVMGLSVSAGAWAVSPSKTSAPPVTATASAAALININTADLKTLENIDGLGPTKAQAIIDYRNKNGNFKTVQDLDKVSGIGPKLFAKIQSQVTV